MTSGRELLPLLPLEYVHINRVAEILNCKVEDILHWQEIGAISLFVKIKRTEGQLLVSDTYFDGEEDFNSYLDDRVYKFGVSRFFYNGYSKFNLDYFPSWNSKPYIYKASLEIPEYPQKDKLAIPGYVSGLWIVMPITAKEIVTSNEDFVTIHGFFLEPDAKQPADVIIHMPAVIEIMKGELWVARPDLEKLYKSITTGEPLANIYNNAELAQRAKEQEKASQRTRTPRTSHPQSEMIRALLLLHPDITEEQLATPHKLHSVLTEIFKATNGKAIMPDVHPNTFERWLKATTNS